MKKRNNVFVFSFFILLIVTLGSECNFIVAKTDANNTLTVQLKNIGGGQSFLTNDFTHSSTYAAMLSIPSNASQGSGCMALYSYSKPFSSLSSFQIYVAYTNATPRFVVLLDTTADGLSDVVLLSDYQLLGDGSWQLSQGGQRWGWTESSFELNSYGKIWSSFNYWKNVYWNATVLFVGVALEYWAVKDANGLDQQLYADEIIVSNSEMYHIAPPQIPNSLNIDDWSMFRHDPQCSGFSSSPVFNGELLWLFFTGPSPVSSSNDRLRASPTVANGVVYIGSNNSNFHALNATTGAPIWQVNVGSLISSSTAVVNGIVYVGLLWNGNNGYVLALNATDGSEIWRFATNSGIESSPTVFNGVVYIGSYLGYVYALDANNGVLKWSYLTGGSTFSSPSIAGNVLYIGSKDGKVYSLNASNGNLIWAFQTGSPVYASPAVVDNSVYVICDNGAILALKTSDGTKMWQANIGVGDHTDTSPAVASGIAFFSARNGLYAFNASTGTQIWFFTSPYSSRQMVGYMYSSPAVAGNSVYWGSPDCYVFSLNAFNGSILWSYRTGGFLFSSPSVTNGVLYIGSYDGNVYAIGTPNSLPPPQPTTSPITQPIPIPTNTTSITPTPTSSPQATPYPTTTVIPNSNQALVQNSMVQPTETPKAVEQTQQSIDWIVLGVIAGLASFALIGLFYTFKKTFDNTGSVTKVDY